MRTLVNVIGISLAVAGASAWSADDTQNRVVAPTPIEVKTTQQESAIDADTTHDADNTGINARDRDGASVTPQTQSNQPADRDLLAAVRKQIVGDNTLSMAAHNVKVHTSDGVVTLRGPVDTEAEKAQLEELAQQVTGVTSVENELDVDNN